MLGVKAGIKKPVDVVGGQWEAIKAVDGSRSEEKYLHSHLERYRVVGEWFTVSCMVDSEFQRVFGEREHRQLTNLSLTRKQYNQTPRNPRTVRIIEMREEGLTLKQIGEEFGVSRERVRQVIKSYNGSAIRTPQSLHREKIKEAGKFRMEFARSIKAHLLDCGIIYCWRCESWTANRPESQRNLCRKCATDMHAERYGKRPDLRGISQSERIRILISEGKMLNNHAAASEGHSRWWGGLSDTARLAHMQRFRNGKAKP